MEFTTGTHIFKLTSGVECEIEEFTGKQQEILTKQDGRTHTERLDSMLASVLVRVGSKKDIDEEFVNAMLGSDKKLCLATGRQFSLGFQDSFEIDYEYTDRDDQTQHEIVEVPLIDKGFPVKMVQVMADVPDPEDETKTIKQLVDASYTEYDQIERKRRVTLPRTGLEVEYTLLDGKGEKIGNAVKKKDRSSHTLIEMRRPVYFEKKTGGGSVPINMANQLSKLPYMDIEHLRKDIKANEGDVETEVNFEHPEADRMPAAEKIVKLDVLGTVGFFFPSGAI